VELAANVEDPMPNPPDIVPEAVDELRTKIFEDVGLLETFPIAVTLYDPVGAPKTAKYANIPRTTASEPKNIKVVFISIIITNSEKECSRGMRSRADGEHEILLFFRGS
jgi:hypothetical protein